MKKIIISLIAALVIGCGVQNNVNFTTQAGSCADGSVNAPYCMAITIQNNAGGQNFISSTNFAFSGLTISVSGPSNVGYPNTTGSQYDPNGCLNSTINPGGSCTFFLQLSGESIQIGQIAPVTVTANYNINNSLFGNSSTSASGSITVYEQPNLLITGMLNSVAAAVNYNNSGFSSSYQVESGENVINAVVNDNIYGYLYVAGNNGIYVSGNSTYTYNAGNSFNVTGAVNLLLSGSNLYAVPSIEANQGYIYTTQIQRESYYWSNYASGLIDVATNVATIDGNSLFFSQASVPQAYYCTTGVGGNGCNAEAASIPNATVITALAYTNLGSLFSGLVAGASNGLWVESGNLGSANNSWTQVTVGGTAITNQIVAITSDNNGNLYIVDSAGKFYLLGIGAGNQATQYTMWGEIPGVVAITVDNPSMTDGSGGNLYASTSSGQIYQCPLSAGSSCSSLGAATGFSSVNSLNVVTSLTASN